jgi:putative oxidoreductase
MFRPKLYLIAGGTISALISIFHLFLAIKPEYYRYIAPGQESALAQMAAQGSSLITTASIVLALIFAIWAVYAFSGAGLVGRLPLLGKALIAIGVIYILRSLFFPSEINMVLTQGYPFRFVVYSAISLVAGLLYLIGFLKQRGSLTPGR